MENTTKNDPEREKERKKKEESPINEDERERKSSIIFFKKCDFPLSHIEFSGEFEYP